MKKLINGICMTLIGLFLSVSLNAQETETQTEPMRLSIEEAVELALKNNISLESSLVGLSTRRRASNYSWNQFIPNVTVAGAYSKDIPRTTNTVSSVSPYGTPIGFSEGNPIFGSVTAYSGTYDGPLYAFAIPINVSLTLSMTMIENMKRLKIDYENGVLNYENAKIQLERDVRKAYHNLILLQENMFLLRGSFNNIESQVQTTQALYNAGLVPELDLLEARVARENMRPLINRAENRFRHTMAQFAMFLGLDTKTQFELIPIVQSIEFLTIDIDDMVLRSSSNNPEVQEIINNIRMLRSMRMGQAYSLTPALTVSWGTTPTYIGSPANSWKSTFSSSLTISLGFRLHSFLPFNSDFQSIRAIDDQIRTTEIRLTQLVTGNEIEVTNLVLSLERIRLSAEAQRETVNLAEKVYRLNLEAYRAGLKEYFQVQNALQSLHEARVQMLEQQFDYLNGLIDLEYAIGVPFGTILKQY